MFYPFRQNNSGGEFKPPAIYVYVEAESEEDANRTAQDYIYFNGCEYGRDCSCCGDRWSETFYTPVEDPKQEVLKAKWGKFDRIWAKEAGISLFMLVYKEGRSEYYNADWVGDVS